MRLLLVIAIACCLGAAVNVSAAEIKSISRLARRKRLTSSSSGMASGPATSTVLLTGGATATSASAAATSSDAIGWISAGDRRITSPTVADWAMPPTSSKNCVARRMV